MKYRSEIDGLRALAVLPVIFFHAGINAVSGGFLGVDIFFVISGYLITSLILEDLEKSRFSLKNFYERRVRRLLPALFFMILCCLPFAWAWMMPAQLKDFAQSLVAVSVFASNLLFWIEADYFAGVAEEKPLLHTWSLGVEEQYYLLFPLLLIFLWRFKRTTIQSTLLVLAICSLILSLYVAEIDRSAAFYLMPTRIWELLVGALVATYVNKHGLLPSKGLSWIGLFSVLAALVFYDANLLHHAAFVGVVVAGTALIIISATAATAVGRLLQLSPLVGIGLISYSAYLWHQPIFAFTKIRLLDEPSLTLMLSLSVISLVLGYFSWRFVETPFRHPAKHKSSTLMAFSGTALGSAIFIVLGLLGHQQDGFKQRFNIPSKVYDSLAVSSRKEECFGVKVISDPENWYCFIGAQNKPVKFAVFGDSHVLHNLPGLESAAESLNIRGIVSGFGSCPPLLNVFVPEEDGLKTNCHDSNTRLYEFIKNSDITHLFLFARWTLYTDGGYSGKKFRYISTKTDGAESVTLSRAAFETGLIESQKAYEKIGVKLIIAPQLPQQKHDPMDLYSLATRDDTYSLEDLSVSREDHEQLQSYSTSAFKKHGIEIFIADDALCDEEKCLVGTENESFYMDDNHLSLSGSEKLKPYILKLFQKTFAENNASDS